MKLIFRNDSEFTSDGDAIRKLSPSVIPVEQLIHGAAYYLTGADGSISPSRFSAEQAKVLARLGREEQARATAGIRIEFTTMGTAFSFDLAVTSGLDETDRNFAVAFAQAGSMGTMADGIVDGLDITVDGHTTTLPVCDGPVFFPFPNPEANPVKVSIALPSIMGISIKNFKTNGTILPVVSNDYLLALGDSIIQGYIVGYPSLSLPACVARQLGLDFVNQAIAGHGFDSTTLAGKDQLCRKDPSVILVGYGTNDWRHAASAEQIEYNATVYFDKLVHLFPDASIYVLSPLWRADAAEAVPCDRPLTWIDEMLRVVSGTYKNVQVINGWNALPHDARLYADARLHPSSIGAGMLSEYLVDAIQHGPRELQTNHNYLDACIRTVRRLRQPDGCPWDIAQTHDTIRGNMLEEAYECVDAIDSGDTDHLIEELGDVLLQVLLHAQIADDNEAFTIEDVARTLNEKLIRRHPHVFSRARRDDALACSADRAADVWQAAKTLERKESPEPASLLDSVSHVLPALMQCREISKRIERIGFSAESTEDIWQRKDGARTRCATAAQGARSAEEEFGDMLFSLVNMAYCQGIDAEVALRSSCNRFQRRWRSVEQMAKDAGLTFADMSHERFRELWSNTRDVEAH